MIVVGPGFLRERWEQRRRKKQRVVSNSRGADSDCSLSERGWFMRHGLALEHASVALRANKKASQTLQQLSAATFGKLMMRLRTGLLWRI